MSNDPQNAEDGQRVNIEKCPTHGWITTNLKTAWGGPIHATIPCPAAVKDKLAELEEVLEWMKLLAEMDTLDWEEEE